MLHVKRRCSKSCCAGWLNDCLHCMQAAPGRVSKAVGPYKEAIVFMIGGGNYLEYESLTTWAGRAIPPKSIVYGATELLSGSQFAEQLAELGRRSGV